MDYKYFWTVRFEPKRYSRTYFKIYTAKSEASARHHAKRLEQETGLPAYVGGPHIHWEHYNVPEVVSEQ